MSKNYLSRNDELRKGDYLVSNNGQWKAIFHDDANFVIYGWKPVWASDSCGSDAVHLCMQSVMYNQCDTPKWATDSNRSESNMCRLQLTDDGKLVVYRKFEELRSSANSRGSKK